MSNDTTVSFLNPALRDEITDLIRAHAQTAIRQVIVASLEAFLGRHSERRYRPCGASQCGALWLPARAQDPDCRRARQRLVTQAPGPGRPGPLLPVTGVAAVSEKDPLVRSGAALGISEGRSNK